MSLAYNIFGIEIDNITLTDLNEFFKNEREESDILEFKSFFEKNQNNYKEKEKAVLKTICGFLNSNGGILIWGAPIGKNPEGKKEKTFTGELSPVEKNIEKDAFISKITNRIIPLPAGIKFKKIDVDKGTDKYIYIIEGPESETKPHQFDNRYFMRLDGQTQKAPHHYIEALFKQVKYPNLGGYIKFGKLDATGNAFLLNITIFIFNHSPLQNEENVSYSLIVENGIFKNLQPQIINTSINYHNSKQQLSYKNISEVLHYGSPHYHEEIITINPRDLTFNNNEVDFYLHFGGRFSPMKVSQYKMRIDSYLYKNSTSLVYFKEENKLMYDLTKNEESEEDKINKILER